MNLPSMSRKYSSEAENVNGDDGSIAAPPSTASATADDILAALAAVLTGLDPTARATLNAMLMGVTKRKPSKATTDTE
jgi:hypothetical protein